MVDDKKLRELGEKPVLSLLMQYAVPAIVAMVASSLYNIIDGVFIGQGVGPGAIMGLALTLPVMNISAAFGAMVGVGGSTLMSVKLGEKDYKIAQKCNNYEYNRRPWSRLGDDNISEPDFALFRSKRLYVALCTRFPYNYFGRQCVYAFVLGAECNDEVGRKASPGHVCHDNDRSYQCNAGSVVHIPVRVGNTWRGSRNGYGTGDCAAVAIQAAFKSRGVHTPA